MLEHTRSFEQTLTGLTMTSMASDAKPAAPKKIRIISIDGGGIGGIIPAQLIARLTEKHPEFVERADVIAGTSTGGIIAVALAKGITAHELVRMYKLASEQIFEASIWRKIGKLFRAKHSNKGLANVLRTYVGDSTLGSLKKDVFVPVVALKRPDGRHTPSGYFLSTLHRTFNQPGKDKYHSEDWKCLDVLLATSAAPTYFPAYPVKPEVNGGWKLWDGGLAANNPALAVISELCRFASLSELDFNIVSFGTGYVEQETAAGDWGEIRSARAVISTMLDVSVGSTAYFLRHLFPNRVTRVNPKLNAEYELNDSTVASELEAAAGHYFDNNLRVTAKLDEDKKLLSDWLVESGWLNRPAS